MLVVVLSFPFSASLVHSLLSCALETIGSCSCAFLKYVMERAPGVVVADIVVIVVDVVDVDAVPVAADLVVVDRGRLGCFASDLVRRKEDVEMDVEVAPAIANGSFAFRAIPIEKPFVSENFVGEAVVVAVATGGSGEGGSIATDADEHADTENSSLTFFLILLSSCLVILSLSRRKYSNSSYNNGNNEWVVVVVVPVCFVFSRSIASSRTMRSWWGGDRESEYCPSSIARDERRKTSDARCSVDTGVAVFFFSNLIGHDTKVCGCGWCGLKPCELHNIPNFLWMAMQDCQQMWETAGDNKVWKCCKWLTG